MGESVYEGDRFENGDGFGSDFGEIQTVQTIRLPQILLEREDVRKEGEQQGASEDQNGGKQIRVYERKKKQRKSGIEAGTRIEEKKEHEQADQVPNCQSESLEPVPKTGEEAVVEEVEYTTGEEVEYTTGEEVAVEEGEVIITNSPQKRPKKLYQVFNC